MAKKLIFDDFDELEDLAEEAARYKVGYDALREEIKAQLKIYGKKKHFSETYQESAAIKEIIKVLKELNKIKI